MPSSVPFTTPLSRPQHTSLRFSSSTVISRRRAVITFLCHRHGVGFVFHHFAWPVEVMYHTTITSIPFLCHCFIHFCPKKTNSLRLCTPVAQAAVPGFFVMCGTTPGVKKISPKPPHIHTPYFFGGFGIFGRKRQKTFRPKNGPKMAQKWSKMAKIAPKSAK